MANNNVKRAAETLWETEACAVNMGSALAAHRCELIAAGKKVGINDTRILSGLRCLDGADAAYRELVKCLSDHHGLMDETAKKAGVAFDGGREKDDD